MKKPKPPKDFPDLVAVLKGEKPTEEFARETVEYFNSSRYEEYKLKDAQYREHQEAENYTYLMKRLEKLKQQDFTIKIERVPLRKSGMSTLVRIGKDESWIGTGFPDFMPPRAMDINLNDLIQRLQPS